MRKIRSEGSKVRKIKRKWNEKIKRWKMKIEDSWAHARKERKIKGNAIWLFYQKTSGSRKEKENQKNTRFEKKNENRNQKILGSKLKGRKMKRKWKENYRLKTLKEKRKIRRLQIREKNEKRKENSRLYKIKRKLKVM